MAMSVGSADDDETPISDINTTPLVDIMLVLLIIFLITVPVVLQAVPVQLPSVQYEVTETKPENVNLSIKGGPGGTCGSPSASSIPPSWRRRPSSARTSACWREMRR